MIDRKFGIELEFSAEVTQSCVSAALSNRDIAHDRMGYAHSRNNPRHHLKTDSTCGYEIASKVEQGLEGLNDIRKLTSALDDIRQNEDMGVSVNRSCGFHVHVDVSDLTTAQIANLIRLVAKSENAIFGMQPQSRTGSRWCKSIRHSHYHREEVLFGRGRGAAIRRLAGDRYFGLNLERLASVGTVEFRYGAGTLDPEKVEAWVLMCLALVERAKGTKCPKITGKTLRVEKGNLIKYVNTLGKQNEDIADRCAKAVKVLNKRFKKFSANRASERMVA